MAADNKCKDNNVLERILELMKYQKVTDRDLENRLGIGKGMVSHWRNGRNTYLQYINAICEYLKTNPNYIFGGVNYEDEMVHLSPVEKDLIKKYNLLTDKQKKYVYTGIELLLE